MSEARSSASATPPLSIAKEFTITQLKSSEEVLTNIPQLTHILQDCVNDGSSIGFLGPLSDSDAKVYWEQVAKAVSVGNLHHFILTTSSESTLLGTVQLSTIPKVAHLHRGEVVKLMVSPSARRCGIARLLMSHIEAFARGIGKSMLTLDTATESPARNMYTRLGWEEWGTCKDYASWPDGSRCDATFFRKEI